MKDLGKTGVKASAIGMSTWSMGGFSSRNTEHDKESTEALKFEISLGMTLIDTAEMYGRDHSEEIVSEIIQSRRDELFIATKVSPENFSFRDVIKAVEASLKRVRISCIDLYQLHWPNPNIPIKETMRAMEQLVAEGKIRFIGVSNFSVEQTRAAAEALSRNEVVSNQLEYSLLDRGIEDKLLPYCEKEGITVIAYSPLTKGKIPQGGARKSWAVLDELAQKYHKSRSQVAFNWLIKKPNVIAIPKASSLDHVRENAEAAGWCLIDEDASRLDLAFR